MRKKILVLFTLFVISFQGFSQPLSPAARISLLVCAPGDEIYSYFGHAAIRFNDAVSGRDIVFHYGEFDYGSSYLNFCWRFAKGETDYKIGVQRMSSFMQLFSSRESEWS